MRNVWPSNIPHFFYDSQRHSSFAQFIQVLDTELQAVKQLSPLPLDLPSVTLVDNVSSHKTNCTADIPKCRQEKIRHLPKRRKFPWKLSPPEIPPLP